MSQTNDVISSANITNFSSFPSTLIPLICLSFHTEIANSSSTMIKRDGESGSPWRTPLLRLKEGVEQPLFVTELEMLL